MEVDTIVSHILVEFTKCGRVMSLGLQCGMQLGFVATSSQVLPSISLATSVSSYQSVHPLGSLSVMIPKLRNRAPAK
jgi:hypothetical protein